MPLSISKDTFTRCAGAATAGRFVAVLCATLAMSACDASPAPSAASGASDASAPVVSDAPKPPVQASAPSSPSAPQPEVSKAGTPNPAPSAPADDALQASFSACVEAAGGVDVEMQACIASEYKDQDDRLNRLYGELKRTLDAGSMNTLREEQRRWLRDRDAQCAGGAAGGGSAERLQDNYCLMEATAKRADALAALLDDRD